MKNPREIKIGQVRMIPGIHGQEIPGKITSVIPDIYYVILELSKADNMVRIKILAGSADLEAMWWDKEYVALDVVVM